MDSEPGGCMCTTLGVRVIDQDRHFRRLWQTEGGKNEVIEFLETVNLTHTHFLGNYKVPPPQGCQGGRSPWLFGIVADLPLVDNSEQNCNFAPGRGILRASSELDRQVWLMI